MSAMMQSTHASTAPGPAMRGGFLNVCESIPVTCQEEGFNCGMASDGFRARVESDSIRQALSDSGF